MLSKLTYQIGYMVRKRERNVINGEIFRFKIEKKIVVRYTYSNLRMSQFPLRSTTRWIKAKLHSVYYIILWQCIVNRMYDRGGSIFGLFG